MEAASSDLVTVKPAMQPGVVNQELIDKLGGILSIGNASARNPQWQTVLTAMRAKDALAIKELFRAKAKDGRHLDSEFEAFCHRWGQLDGPAAAQNIVGEYAGKEQIVAKVMQGWGSRDADAALAWASQQPGISQGTSIGAIVEGLASGGPAKPKPSSWQIPEMPLLKSSMAHAAFMVAQEGLSGTLPWFEQIASGDSPDKFKTAKPRNVAQDRQSKHRLEPSHPTGAAVCRPSLAALYCRGPNRPGLLGQDPIPASRGTARMP